MRFDIFQSDTGDCFLLESKDGRRILCDGGMSSSMKSHVSPVLARLRKAGKTIDYVYVSHIDSDHISGVLGLLQDELQWRIFDHHSKKPGSRKKAPKVPRPPKIGGIWHNAFRTQIGKNAGPVEDLLAASVPAFLATHLPELEETGEELYTIATSVKEAIKLSRLSSGELLGIPLNRVPGAGGAAPLLMRRKNQKPFKVGSLKFTILGPGEAELEKLREGWNNWLRDNKAAVEQLNAQIQKSIDEFSSGVVPAIGLKWNDVPNFKGVSVPNIASLIFMVEEGDRRLLLTGDSQQDIILDGLRATGFLDDDAGLHVDALKMPHHGSKHNFDENFARLVSADHYVFSGNGDYGNPTIKVINEVFESRLGPHSKRAISAKAKDRPFKLWFSSTSTSGPSNAEERAHMRAVEKHVKGLVQKSKGRMKAVFNGDAYVTLKL